LNKTRRTISANYLALFAIDNYFLLRLKTHHSIYGRKIFVFNF